MTALHYPAASSTVQGAAMVPIQPLPAGGTPTTFTIVDGSLPPGITLDPATGVISGAPTAPGVFTATIQAGNAAGTTSEVLTFTELPSASLSVAYSTPRTFAVGAAIPAQAPALANDTPGIATTYAVTASGLPPGLALGGDGTISGTPTAAGTSAFTVTATNGTRNASCDVAYTVTYAAPLSLAYPASQVFNQGTAIPTQAPVLGQQTPGLGTTFSVTAGTLPAGLTLNGDGTITGAPTVAGTFTFTVDAVNGARDASFTSTYIVVPAAALTLGYATAQTFPAGAVIAAQVPAVGNATPGMATTFALSSGALPTGLTLNADGSITGTPTTPGVSTFTVTATNGARTATSSPSYTVLPVGSLALNYTTPLTVPAGAPLGTQSPALANATPGLATTYATTGSLPAGLALNADGTITGTPLAAGVYTFAVTATNGGRTAQETLTYTVTPAAALTLGYTTPLTFTQNAAFATQSPTLANPTPGIPTTFALTGTLPTGLLLNADGTITGTPTAPGVFAFAVTATNGARTAQSAVTWTVTPSAALTLGYSTPATFIQGAVIATQTPVVANPTPGIPTTFVVTAGSLPTGLTLNANGTITGTPSVTGTSAFTVTATNGARTATANVSYTVNLAAPSALNYTTPITYPEKSIITPNLPNPSGGTPTTYAITAGSLPAGLTLNADGSITGTPSGATGGPVSVTIKGSNGVGNASQTLSITVAPIIPAGLNYVTPVTYTNGTTITPNLPNPTVTGGTPSYYAVTSGILPLGLTFDPTTGTISGKPSAATTGAVAITVTGTNTAGSASQVLSITVNDTAPTTLNYAPSSTYTNGTPIPANNPNYTGGAPASYAVTTGALPAGLILDPVTGIISGKPTATVVSPGTTLTITGTNTAGSASQSITIIVNSSSTTSLNYITPVTYLLNAVVENDPKPTGGTPTGYAVTGSTSLPAGLTLNAGTGAITGSPSATTNGPVAVTIQATGSGTISQTISINVPAPIVAAFSANPVTVPVGQAASLTAIYAGGTGSISDSLSNSLGGISSGATISTPSYASPTSVTYTLTVTNGGASPDATRSVTVQWVTTPTTLNLSVPAAGGVSTPDVSDSSSPFYGAKITVPALDATCSATDLTIFMEAALPGTVTAPATACSQTYNMTSTVGYPFRSPITLTLPYSAAGLSATDVPVPFYWDPAYGTWVANGVKALDTTNHLVTFTTLLPGRYVIIAIPGLAASLATTTTGFVYNVDGWFQPNQGVYDLPGGSSFGMSAFASWYFSERKAGNAGAGLYSLFRQGPIASDDVNAAALISRLANGTLDGWSKVADQAAYQLTDTQTGLALITAMTVTGQPQVFIMGEARPAVQNALATLVYAYDNTAKKFSVMDPNYPGTNLTITWTPAAPGSFSSYDRAEGYFPAFAAYAFEGQTSIHRLVDYERAFQGATLGWTNPPFATVGLGQVGNLANPVLNGATLKVNDASNVAVAGTVTSGDEGAMDIFWSQNGGVRTAVPLSGGAFNFSLGALEDPYGTMVMLETTANACDPTFGHTGFLEFWVKDQALQPWFANPCFEDGKQSDGLTPVGWTLQQGSNSGVGYPATASWNAQGAMTGYNVNWNVSPIDSDIVTAGNDPEVSSIPAVLDGATSFRLNNAATGSHISHLFQTITVPTIVAVPKLSFYWAAVLEDPNHTPAQQPYVDILIQDVTDPNGVTVVFYQHFFAGDPNYPGWVLGSSDWKGIPWQKVNLANLTSLKGHQLKITVTAADCTQGGHGGYVYLDSIGCN